MKAVHVIAGLKKIKATSSPNTAYLPYGVVNKERWPGNQTDLGSSSTPIIL